MYFVESTGFFCTQVFHARGDNAKSGIFKPGVNLANNILADSVGFNDGNSTFYSHFKASPGGKIKSQRMIAELHRLAYLI